MPIIFRWISSDKKELRGRDKQGMKKKIYICFMAIALLLTAACGGTPKEKIKQVQDAYAVSVSLHNEMVEAYADVEDDSLGAELDEMAERLKSIGKQDAQGMTAEELEAIIIELEEKNVRYGEMKAFLEELEEMEQKEEEKPMYAVPVTIANNTGVELFELYLYKVSDEDKGDNLVEDIGYLEGYQTRSILNLYMGEDERVWYLEAKDEEGHVIEAVEVDFTGYEEKGVTINMKYSFDAMEGWIEME